MIPFVTFQDSEDTDITCPPVLKHYDLLFFFFFINSGYSSSIHSTVNEDSKLHQVACF